MNDLKHEMRFRNSAPVGVVETRYLTSVRTVCSKLAGNATNSVVTTFAKKYCLQIKRFSRHFYYVIKIMAKMRIVFSHGKSRKLSQQYSYLFQN